MAQNVSVHVPEIGQPSDATSNYLLNSQEHVMSSTSSLQNIVMEVAGPQFYFLKFVGFGCLQHLPSANVFDTVSKCRRCCHVTTRIILNAGAHAIWLTMNMFRQTPLAAARKAWVANVARIRNHPTRSGGGGDSEFLQVSEDPASVCVENHE